MQSVELQDANGNFVTLTRTPDNYFQGGGFTFPATIRITSITGAPSARTARASCSSRPCRAGQRCCLAGLPTTLS